MRKLLGMAAALAAVLMLAGSVSAQGKKGFGKFGKFGGGGGGVAALLASKDVQKDLKLTDEQIARLDQLQIQQMGVGAFFFNAKLKEKLDLSQDQTEKMQAMQKELGPKIKELFEGFKEASKEDKEAAMKKMADLQQGLLADALKVLNADQKKAYEDMCGAPAKVPPGPGSLEKNLELTDEQTKRIGQLQIQQQGANALLNNPKVGEKVNLSAEQKDKVMEIAKEFGPKFKEAFQGFNFFKASKEEREEMTKKMGELRKEQLAEALKVLNGDQKKAYEELSGEPFKGVLPFGGGGFGMGMGMGMGGAETNAQFEARRAPRLPAIARRT